STQSKCNCVAEWNPIVLTSGAKLITPPVLDFELVVYDYFYSQNCSSLGLMFTRLTALLPVSRENLWIHRAKVGQFSYERAFHCRVF
ncbi:hypothetical protein Ocin01_18977, partial [Orchesella cincta]